MSHFYLGIDVAKAKLDCALRLPSGKIRAKIIPNSPDGFTTLLAWLTAQKADSVHVCMEATGVYWEAIAQHLATAGLTVSIVNPAQIKAYGASRLTRSKTDTVDAKLIADFCAERQPPAWQPRSEAEVTLRALVLRLDALQTMRTQESNRLQVAREAVREDIQQHLNWLDTAIQQLIDAINDHIDRHPELKQQRELHSEVAPSASHSIASIAVHIGTFAGRIAIGIQTQGGNHASPYSKTSGGDRRSLQALPCAAFGGIRFRGAHYRLCGRE
jgi:transposase